MRLPRTHSITEHSVFQNVRTAGVSKPGRFFVLGTLENPVLEGLHIGLITTKKIGNAVVRNRTRRYFRAVLVKHGDKLKEGRYLVFIARWRAKEADFFDIEKDFLKLAKRLDLMKEEL